MTTKPLWETERLHTMLPINARNSKCHPKWMPWKPLLQYTFFSIEQPQGQRQLPTRQQQDPMQLENISFHKGYTIPGTGLQGKVGGGQHEYFFGRPKAMLGFITNSCRPNLFSAVVQQQHPRLASKILAKTFRGFSVGSHMDEEGYPLPT